MAKKKPSSKASAKASANAGDSAAKSDLETTEQPSFEETLSQLETIVAELEAGSLSLSDSIGRYEHGVGLLKKCHGALDQAQRRIELLTKVDEQGQTTTVPFDAGRTGEEPSRSGRKKASGDVPDGNRDVDDEGRLF